jgi:hypothetical protein
MGMWVQEIINETEKILYHMTTSEPQEIFKLRAKRSLFCAGFIFHQSLNEVLTKIVSGTVISVEKQILFLELMDYIE